MGRKAESSLNLIGYLCELHKFQCILISSDFAPARLCTKGASFVVVPHEDTCTILHYYGDKGKDGFVIKLYSAQTQI